jgi:Skp family chaperone for outer membrane proteins
LDATTIGAVLAFAGVLSGSVVAYLGKRGENANTRMNSEFDQIQEERDKMREQLAARDQKIEGLLEQRLVDREEIARLRVRVVELGGDP